MRLPEIAEELLQIAHETGNNRLAELSHEIYRRPSVRGRVTSVKVTDRVRGSIRSFAVKHPHLSQAEIARRYRVNPARVSEVLHGFRT